LKPKGDAMAWLDGGRAPRGARGLKRNAATRLAYLCESRPARGAWIETANQAQRMMRKAVAPRAGRVD